MTCLAIGAAAKTVAHFDMQVKSGCITETVSGLTFPVEGYFACDSRIGRYYAGRGNVDDCIDMGGYAMLSDHKD